MTNSPDSLPSLELMKSANRLLEKATAMDRKNIFDLMKSYNKVTSEDEKWEVIGIWKIERNSNTC